MLTEKTIRIWTPILLVLYFGAVLFCLLYTFDTQEMDLPTTFLGIPLDKIVHFVMFCPSVVLTATNYRFWQPQLRVGFCVFIAALVCILFAGTTEICQGTFTETRQMDIWDFAADCVGILASAIFSLPFLNYLKNIIHQHNES